MALIKCSECGREISDKSNACIHCGNPIIALKEKEPEQEQLVLHKENTQKFEAVKDTNSKKHNSKSPLKSITWIILAVILVISAVLYFNYRNTETKKQSVVLYEIYLDLKQAYVHVDEAFIKSVTILSNEKKYWDTDLEAAFYSVYNRGAWDKSDIVSARELLEKVDIALETNSKANIFLPNQLKELREMRDVIDDYFYYVGMRNPETDTKFLTDDRFKTGPEWMDYFGKMVEDLNVFDELEKNFLKEINRLR